MYKNILIPVDGSEGSGKALHEAAKLAAKFDAKIYLLHVRESSTAVDYMAYSDSDPTSQIEFGQKVLDESRQKLNKEGIEQIEIMMQEGQPAHLILKYVENLDIDLIVMGTHGRRGLDHMLMGSVAEKVVRLSAVPVMTVQLRHKEKVSSN